MAGPGPSPAQLIGIVYALALFCISAFLWKTNRFSTKLKYILLLVTVLIGFATFSPMIPYQFQELVISAGSITGIGILGAAVGMATFFLLTFFFGRHFCGFLCPIGALQELAYTVPSPKARIPWKMALSVARAAVFFTILISGLGFSVAVLSLFGIRQFFTLTLSIGFAVFLGVILVSLVFYRPFCRLICPVAVVFQVLAAPARWKIRRTDACIECGKCERACPTNEAKRGDLKSECYLCRRCMDVCPADGALRYGGSWETPCGARDEES